MTLAILLPLFYIIPREISKLSELLNKQSKYSRRFQGSVGGHVVVCGSHVQRAAAEGFLTEFYHADHGEQKRKVPAADVCGNVVLRWLTRVAAHIVWRAPRLCSCAPSSLRRSLRHCCWLRSSRTRCNTSPAARWSALSLQRLAPSMQMLCLHSPHSSKTTHCRRMRRQCSLSRVGPARRLRTRKHATSSLMRPLWIIAISRVIASHIANCVAPAVTSTVPWVPVYCQLVNPMSKVHASWAEWSHLVCTDELKMNILAKSCLCPVRGACLPRPPAPRASHPARLAVCRGWPPGVLHPHRQPHHLLL